MTNKNKKALILVDLQNDFCRKGSLEVPDADEIIPLANRLQPYFDLVIATQDWHPKDHISFASNHPGHRAGEVLVFDEMPQVLWPDHCVEGSKGANFHGDLDIHRFAKIFHKGIDKNIDSYSAFFDNAHKRATGLGDYLHHQQVDDVYILGLATDYCIKYSALDAIRLGFSVYVIEDACRGVELKPGDIAGAIEKMVNAGVHIIQSKDIFEHD